MDEKEFGILNFIFRKIQASISSAIPAVVEGGDDVTVVSN